MVAGSVRLPRPRSNSAGYFPRGFTDAAFDRHSTSIIGSRRWRRAGLRGHRQGAVELPVVWRHGTETAAAEREGPLRLLRSGLALRPCQASCLVWQRSSASLAAIGTASRPDAGAVRGQGEIAAGFDAGRDAGQVSNLSVHAPLPPSVALARTGEQAAARFPPTGRLPLFLRPQRKHKFSATVPSVLSGRAILSSKTSRAFPARPIAAGSFPQRILKPRAYS